MVTQGLSMILDMSESIAVAGTASNGQEAIDFVKENHVDVIVMDISMPVMDGLTASEHIKSNFPRIKILILTTYNHRKLIHKLVELKLDGCLLKDQSAGQLTVAIERVMQDKSYYDNIADFDHVPQAPALGERELQVLKAYCLNKTYAEIAEELGLSKLTVKTHLRNIRRKLELDKATDLIQYSVNQGLI